MVEKTTVEVLRHIIINTAIYAENWPKYRSIFSLPEGMTLESPEVRKNPNAFIDRSEWSDLVDDIERWSEIESAAYGCAEVKAEYQRLQTALNVLRDMKNIPFRGSL